MLFNALHREGSNMAMISGKTAAEAILEAKRQGRYDANALSAYTQRLRESFIFKDLKKYRKFPGFLHKHKELFSTLPELGRHAALEMLTVDGVPKKDKQRAIWKNIKRSMSRWGLFKLIWDGWRSVK
jgi:electron transfer flavoprotein-quinone oxidoreductase